MCLEKGQIGSINKIVDIGELESYLNDKSANKGDVVEIMSEGTLEVKQDSVNPTKVYRVLNLPVKLNGQRDLIWSPAKLATEALQKLYGRDTKNWVNKKFQVDLVKMSIKGEMKNVIFPMSLEPVKAK